MMHRATQLRIATLVSALLLGWFSVATLFAEAFTPKAGHFPEDRARSNPTSAGVLADWAANAAPLRGDLLAELAITSATAAVDFAKKPATSESTPGLDKVLSLAKRSLAFSPHLSGMWLLLAALENQEEPSRIEALKMSYFTAPADLTLIPARLAIVTSSPAIADEDVRNLARGDIRLILTHRPNMKDAIAMAYRRGSAEGKNYIEEVVRSLDPAFAASLP